MPHHKSAVKRLKKSKEEAARNASRMSRARKAIRKVREAAAGADTGAILRESHSELDRAAAKGVMKKAAASRLKSRLAKHANRIASGSR